IGLIVHYLPSLLRHGDELRLGDLTPAETNALRRADAFLVPSPYMKRTLERLLGELQLPTSAILVVEPECEIRPAASAPPVDAARALVIANLVENKGILELLEALGRHLTPDDPLELRIAGGATSEPDYARKCRLSAERLGRPVVFEGELTPELVERRLHESNLFLSASKMESYGMALGE